MFVYWKPEHYIYSVWIQIWNWDFKIGFEFSFFSSSGNTKDFYFFLYFVRGLTSVYTAPGCPRRHANGPSRPQSSPRSFTGSTRNQPTSWRSEGVSVMLGVAHHFGTSGSRARSLVFGRRRVGPCWQPRLLPRAWMPESSTPPRPSLRRTKRCEFLSRTKAEQV